MKIKTKNVVILILFFMVLIFNHKAFGFNEMETHPKITKSAIEISGLDNFLNQKLDFKDGVETIIPSGSGRTIRFWLEEGAKLEDNPACRASNHFHNPLKAWNESGVDDFLIEDTWRAKKVKEFFALYCDTIGGSEYVPWNSNITWATGGKT